MSGLCGLHTISLPRLCLVHGALVLFYPDRCISSYYYEFYREQLDFYRQGLAVHTYSSPATLIDTSNNDHRKSTPAQHHRMIYEHHLRVTESQTEQQRNQEKDS